MRRGRCLQWPGRSRGVHPVGPCPVWWGGVGAGAGRDSGVGSFRGVWVCRLAGHHRLRRCMRGAIRVPARCRVFRAESLVWLEGYQALRRWREENEITGLHAVGCDVDAAAGSTGAFALGRWVHQQRRALRAANSVPTARSCSTRPAWCGSRARRRGRPSSPRSGPTTEPPDTSPSGRTRSGARAR